MVAYLDDFLVLTKSKEEVLNQPTRRLEMFGLILDPQRALIEVPEEKLARVEELARTLLAQGSVSLVGDTE